MQIRRQTLPAGCLLLTGLALVPACCAQAPDPAQLPRVDHAALDRILRATVRSGNVDYLRIRKSHRSQLRAYLDSMSGVRLDRLPRAEKLTYYINLYNATMIDAIVARLVVGYTPAANEFEVFEQLLVRMAGRTVSLNHLENKIIRPQFKEPRIHVALVCGARSCPPLMPRAYDAARLDPTLQQNMRRFINDPTRNRVDHKAKKLHLSKIFSWYQDDFGGSQGLARYVQVFLATDVSKYEIEQLPYSWKLNLALPAGQWAGVKMAHGRLKKSSYVEVVGGEAKTAEVLDADGKRHSIPRTHLEVLR